MIKEGVVLGKRYEILGRVGSGGMADVYKGKDHKLNRFVAIKVLKDEESVCRELIMVKLRADASQRGEIISVADIFRAKIVDVEEDSLIVELTGTQSKLEAFLNLLKGYEILELARTGITGLSRGSKDVAYF